MPSKPPIHIKVKWVMLTQSSTVEVRNVRAPCVWSIGEKVTYFEKSRWWVAEVQQVFPGNKPQDASFNIKLSQTGRTVKVGMDRLRQDYSSVIAKQQTAKAVASGQTHPISRYMSPKKEAAHSDRDSQAAEGGKSTPSTLAIGVKVRFMQKNIWYRATVVADKGTMVEVQSFKNGQQVKLEVERSTIEEIGNKRPAEPLQKQQRTQAAPAAATVSIDVD
mmetsp:Transcript_49010/g.114684  ORF Transcript_49010/g.114684 Transcript_49010/m.114684 type:complete len:219 (-) Transcript_49010:17-673(-)